MPEKGDIKAGTVAVAHLVVIMNCIIQGWSRSVILALSRKR